jgi:hypothetical protein
VIADIEERDRMREDDDLDTSTTGPSGKKGKKKGKLGSSEPVRWADVNLEIDKKVRYCLVIIFILVFQCDRR